MNEWTVYILKCSDNTLYTGITNNLKKRIKTHNTGKGSRYTRSRLPVFLLYAQAVHDRSEALKKEIQIKKSSKKEKLKLIDQANDIGKRVAKIVESGSQINITSSGTRLLEEVVELCLALGAKSYQIYDSVSDTLHKEANKTGCYPSEIQQSGTVTQEDVKGEISDSLINLLYICHIVDVDVQDIIQTANNKINLLEDLNRENCLHFNLNGKFYRKKS